MMARSVHSGLCTFRMQTLRVGTCAKGHQADMLAKQANTLALSNQSLFGGGLNTMVASSARDYAAMAEGFVQPSFVQAGLHCPKLPRGKES